MRDYINIGPTPNNEDCSQVGTDYYHIKSKIETKAFMQQLYREFPEVLKTKTLSFSVKTFQHEFGSYKEVVLNYDDSNEEEYEMVFDIDKKIPSNWDAESVEYIKINNINIGENNDSTTEL